MPVSANEIDKRENIYISKEKSWDFFMLLSEQHLNPEVFIDIE